MQLIKHLPIKHNQKLLAFDFSFALSYPAPKCKHVQLRGTGDGISCAPHAHKREMKLRKKIRHAGIVKRLQLSDHTGTGVHQQAFRKSPRKKWPMFLFALASSLFHFRERPIHKKIASQNKPTTTQKKNKNQQPVSPLDYESARIRRRLVLRPI